MDFNPNKKYFYFLLIFVLFCDDSKTSFQYEFTQIHNTTELYAFTKQGKAGEVFILSPVVYYITSPIILKRGMQIIGAGSTMDRFNESGLTDENIDLFPDSYTLPRSYFDAVYLKEGEPVFNLTDGNDVSGFVISLNKGGIAFNFSDEKSGDTLSLSIRNNMVIGGRLGVAFALRPNSNGSILVQNNVFQTIENCMNIGVNGLSEKAVYDVTIMNNKCNGLGDSEDLGSKGLILNVHSDYAKLTHMIYKVEHNLIMNFNDAITLAVDDPTFIYKENVYNSNNLGSFEIVHSVIYGKLSFSGGSRSQYNQSHLGILGNYFIGEVGTAIDILGAEKNSKGNQSNITVLENSFQGYYKAVLLTDVDNENSVNNHIFINISENKYSIENPIEIRELTESNQIEISGNDI